MTKKFKLIKVFKWNKMIFIFINISFLILIILSGDYFYTIKKNGQNTF